MMDANYQIIDGIVHEKSGIPVTEQIKAYLAEIRTWAFMLAILGFVSIGFMVLLALFLPSVLTNSSGITAPPAGTKAVLSFVYILIATLYFFPVLYLLNFSRKLKLALQNNDSLALSTAFQFLKRHFKFIGIVLIVFISIYVLIILIAILGSVAAFI
jgi:hypothetical protein